MPTAVKICGITRAEDALVAVECGAAAVGFNFWPGSPRSCDVAVAAGIIAALPTRFAKLASSSTSRRAALTGSRGKPG